MDILVFQDLEKVIGIKTKKKKDHIWFLVKNFLYTLKNDENSV